MTGGWFMQSFRTLGRRDFPTIIGVNQCEPTLSKLNSSVPPTVSKES
jgi:hypothetical protein